ncbi:67 kDa myosin-cross-reactive antigen family protein [Aspergillus sclerotioniger CBS 115572]|uniref:67 kDa myosin-cross-reactive antigen family protein n=1 Tax=Aspergillus sclerotioniger CBS 115572 TaxID=1450535 RepID=A0A317XCH1_9EURO|nr:67 kDa myosin-cross-reactive antigen family protein [Aspergillus sclerotioniger CBS 115572]PWY94240.1 67 kDa myosin-cross-reactive antigen family protein [Aspergillus sclerotioniger CBS 115572]
MSAFKSLLATSTIPSTFDQLPSPHLTIALTLILAYLLLVSALRFQRVRQLRHQYPHYATRASMAQMTDHDAWAIQKNILQLEFPTTAIKALQFALFRTYGTPTISSLLLQTSQLSNPATSFKRYADTGALIGQFMTYAPTSPRARTAIARTRFLHAGYRASGKILESDMLYTLSLFATEPIRFVQRFEWRDMTDLEQCAIGTYWKSLGDALGISYGLLPSGENGFRDGLHFLEEIREWSAKYEMENMRPDETNRLVADKTMDVVVYGFPDWVRGIGVRLATCVMDDRLRKAMMYDAPPVLHRKIFAGIVGLRRFVLRYLAPPRPDFLRLEVFSRTPNEKGRYYVRVWKGMPYYVQPTFWNRWGPGAWVTWAVGLPLPGDEGDTYYPHGFDLADLGPRYFEGKGRQSVREIEDANLPPSRIHILETLSQAGGGTVSSGDHVNGYDYRGGGMPPFNDVCMEELLDLVPSKDDPDQTVLEEINQYWDTEAVKDTPHTRFLTRHKHSIERITAKEASVGLRDRVDLFMMGSKAEKSLGRTRICDHFSKSFFRSGYWLILSTTFGIKPTHSAAEFRRYLQHFMHDIHNLNRRQRLDGGRFNRHESIISPIAQFLRSEGVDFRFHTTVTDIITSPSSSDPHRVSAIKAIHENEPEHTISLSPRDIVLVSLGSVMSGSTTGTNTTPPSLELMEIEKDLDENWLLWLELSTKNPIFGNAYNFCTRMSESRLESFTITLSTPDFFTRFTTLTRDKPGSSTLTTLKDTPWLISLSLPQQPLFPNQPPNIQVLWGYAMYPDREGEFIKKPMLECSGQEIFEEILHQLKFPVREILNHAITIPCVVPRMAATLLPRTDGDRPRVIPPGIVNLGLIGQFVEIPSEVAVTMDYGVRGAQMAVRQLMGLGVRKPSSKRSSTISLLGL